MPYIPQKDRQRASVVPATAGELNYAVTTLALEYVERNGKSYQTFADIISSLEGAKAEFYRRVVAPYEDGKCATNGDVYEEVR